MRRHIVTAIALLLFGAGCSSGASNVEAIEGDDGANASPAEEPSPARTPDGGDADAGDTGDPGVEDPPEPDDPFAVPDEIDEAYIERVLNEISAAESRAVRLSLEPEAEVSSSPSREQLEIVAAIAGPLYRPSLVGELEAFRRSDEARGTQVPLENFGQQRFQVEELPIVSERCVTAVGWFDLTETAQVPFERDQYSAVVLARDETIDREVNSTGWIVWDTNPLRTEEGWLDLEEVVVSSLTAAMDTECGVTPEEGNGP